ncbi:MAG: glycosyltransferase [Phycisphaerales bacterium]|nr:glycosyltransferase [Phycisphaerales bacterium]
MGPWSWNAAGAAGRLPDPAPDAARVGAEWRPLEGQPGLTRMDMHCHSYASSAPLNAALAWLDAPECYSPPEKVYEQARARGMDFVTITDHDSIAGVMELVERGFENVIVGEEVTTHFPEDRCMLHVLLWGLSPEQHEEIGRLGLRDDVYRLADWLAERNLAHALAHPVYVQNNRLTAWHLERCALLFKGWELLNGAHSGTHKRTIERYLGSLTPGRVQTLSRLHGIAPRWSRVWHKALTGGSDDHGLLNIGRTWTGVAGEDGRKVTDGREFLRHVMAGRSAASGDAGHASLLAHQLAVVGANYYAERVNELNDTMGQYVAHKLLRFLGVSAPKPGRGRLLWHQVKRKLLLGKSKSLPVVSALRSCMGPVLERYPELRAGLDPSMWAKGAPVSNHERMAQFSDELCAALSAFMADGAVRALRERDRLGIFDHLISYAIVHLAQLPYLISLFHQNKERNMLEKLEHDTSAPGSGVSVLERPMRVSLFTDTLGDVNGVCRFIQNVAQQARATGRDLQVVTSTGFAVPEAENIFNFRPLFATRMPRYEQLEMVLPPLMQILRHLDRHQPDVVHISTPGPVGLIGFLAAKMLRVPVLGVYHTDFPAYIDRLFDDDGLTKAATWYMRTFYAPFTSIFTRSADYAESLSRLGLSGDRIVRLMPGLETAQFNRSFRDEHLWRRVAASDPRLAGLSRPSVKVLYVGRVSPEKNCPLLSQIWKTVARRCADRGLDAQLVVVGDGPYRPAMEEALAGTGAYFLGFRHGRELSSLYATSDLFVFPSVTDTLGQVVMESQSSGLPVLVTDVGGPKEVVEDGRTGFVLPADDPAQWARRIEELAANPGLRREMGDAAAKSMEKYDLRHSFEHFWEVHTQAWHRHLATLGIRPKGGEARGLAEVRGEPVGV